MKKTFKVIIILLIMMALLNVLYFKYEEHTLEKEIEDVATLNLNENDYNISLKSNYNYAKVEKAVKTYLIDYSNISKELDNLAEIDKLKNILSANNYKEDGKEFNNTIKYLDEYKINLNEKLEELNDISKKEKINSYIENEHLKKYYTDMYDKFMYHSNITSNIESNNKQLQNEVNNIIILIDKEKEVIEFLKSSNNWTIKDDNIIFSSQEELNKYNELIKDLV